jgi:hypothetical protein
MFARTDAAQAAGEKPDTDEIVEAAIDDVLGRTAEDEEMLQPGMRPNEDDIPAAEATAPISGETGDDPRPTATRPLANGHIRGMDMRQSESDNYDDEGRGDLPPPLGLCPLCRR